MDIRQTSSLVIINNVPPDYHSCDLRNYFSQFIESGGFECFHFRHRPETIVGTEPNASAEKAKTSEQKKKSTTCCVVKLKSSKLKEFLRMYNRKHWVDRNGDVMSQICYITKVRTSQVQEKEKLLTRGEQRQIPADRETFSESDLKSLVELQPPDIMPQGNVGTPTMTFMNFIKECRLPPSVIKKLGLSFPRVRTSKQYGNVPFDYGGKIVEGQNGSEDMEVMTASGHVIQAEADSNEDGADRVLCDKKKELEVSEKTGSSSNQGDKTKTKKRKKKLTAKDDEMKRRMGLNIEENMIRKSDESEGDNDSCEEWERHEAMYDDPSNQERNKERLFEEEIELKWEKGGSGLVFYTDAQYWQAQEGDFDEQTVDDHNVDMSGYYEDGAGDKDARDYLTIRQEKHRRDGIESTDRFTAGIAVKKKKTKQYEEDDDTIGKFEAHTRGFGRKIMEKQGWTDGQGLGSSIKGMAEALDNDGQHPRDRSGFGYRGEKLVRQSGPAQRKVIISTVYDDPNVTDPHEPLKRRHEPYHLKYRDEVKFAKAKHSKDAE